MREFKINENDSGQRLDKFITKAVPRLPTSLLYKGIRNKRIKLNGKRAEISTRLAVGDVVTLYINDEFFDESRQSDPSFLHAGDDLTIAYEDENLLVLDKPAGLVVHEDQSGTADTLINRVLKYLFKKGDYRPEEEHSFVPALCNRIDRNTSGLVLCAKNAAALQFLNEKIRAREVEKEYLCVAVGKPPKCHDLCKAFLRKDEKKNQVQVFREPKPGAKTILTEYTVLETAGKLSLLEIKLHTGRTHQIRAHMAFLGCPLLGDTKYGNPESLAMSKKLGLSWQALCAARLTFEFRTVEERFQYLNGKRFSSCKAERLVSYLHPKA